MVIFMVTSVSLKNTDSRSRPVRASRSFLSRGRLLFHYVSELLSGESKVAVGVSSVESVHDSTRPLWEKRRRKIPRFHADIGVSYKDILNSRVPNLSTQASIDASS
jgi:hypothetical protein